MGFKITWNRINDEIIAFLERYTWNYVWTYRCPVTNFQQMLHYLQFIFIVRVCLNLNLDKLNSSIRKLTQHFGENKLRQMKKNKATKFILPWKGLWRKMTFCCLNYSLTYSIKEKNTFSRWSFSPNSAWGRTGTTTIEKFSLLEHTFLNISLWRGFDGSTELDTSPLLGITHVSVSWLMDARKLSALSNAATVFDAFTRPKLSRVGCVSEVFV